MNVFYANPVEINQEFRLEIVDRYPSKAFYIHCSDGKKRAMSGTNAGFGKLDQSHNARLEFHVFWDNPRAILTLQIDNTQSVYFDKLLGCKSQYDRSWVVDCIVTYNDQTGFYVHFPNGIISAKNITC